MGANSHDMRRFLPVLALAASPLVGLGQDPRDSMAAEAYRRILAQMDSRAIRKDTATICAFGARLAGSEGERKALEFVESRFRTLGMVNIRREPFKATVPDPSARGVLEGEGWSVELFPLWPNLVRTSTCDFSGPLAYGRFGTLEDLKGQDLKGSVVVLEFPSRANWKNCFKLGAKAVVLLEPPVMERTEAEQKFSSAPVDAPRFLLPLAKAGPVLRAAFTRSTVRLRCRQNWVVRETWNVLADLPVTDARLKKERVVVGAHADAMSVVPGKAPGASGAASLGVLMELARLSKRNPGKRPMTFMAVSAHGLGLQGWREYAQKRIQEGDPAFLTLSLDLNDGSSTLGAFGRGWYVDFRNESLDPIRGLTRAYREHANRIAAAVGKGSGREVLLDAVNDSDGRHWRNTIYAKFAISSEPLCMAGMNAVTFATAENARERIDTASDDLSRLNFDSIEPQVKVLACLLWHTTRDTSRRGELSAHKVPLELRKPSTHSLVGGFTTIEGQVVAFDPNRSFIADQPVADSLAVCSHSQKTLAGVRGPLVQSVEGPDARYRFIGLPPKSAYFHLERHFTTLGAYALDPKTGAIRVAPNDGIIAWGHERDFEILTSYLSRPISVFRCAATSLYDLVDPQEHTPLLFHQVLDHHGDTTPRTYSVGMPMADLKLSSEQEDCAVLFIAPGARFKLLMGTVPGEWRLVLINSTRKEPGGEGHVARAGSETFPDLSLQAASDLITLNASRLDGFAKYRILSPGLDELQRQASSAYGEALEAKLDKDWPKFERASRAAWGYALRAHPMIQGTINDVVNGVLFYLILLIPFSYFLERLLFARKTLTVQLLTAIGIFVASFLVLRAIHPAFEVVSNPSMIFVAFVMGVLSLLVAGFITGKFESSLREIRAAKTGLGHVDVGRMSVAMAAFNLGVASMRRRKARTILTTLTLIVMTFIVLSFTSIVPGLSIEEAPSEGEAPYPGILVRKPGLEPLHAAAYRAVFREFAGRAAIARRAWFFGGEMSDAGALGIARGQKSLDLRAAVGMEATEANVTEVQEALLPGGRWLGEKESGAAVLPFSVAERLGIAAEDVGEAEVEFGGKTLKVIGILNEAKLRSTVDLDGESVLPADFTLSKSYQTESRSTSAPFRRFLRIDPGTCIFLAFQDAIALGAELRSVAVRFPESKDSRPALQSLMPRLRMNLYAGVPSSSGLEIRQFSVLHKAKSAGLGLVLVQLFIAAAFVLNTMVASVFERKREIGIFSSIGLAPNHIAVLFFAESGVYGVLGSVAGYFLAQAVAKLVAVTGLIPGLYLNFSATSAVLAAGLVLAVVLLSTIYPSKVAARIAAPAYEAEVASEPEGDNWMLALPFRVAASEAEEIVRFFAEWLRGHEEYAVGEFVTAEASWRALSAGSFEAECVCWLAPFDLGVSQRVRIVASAHLELGIAELSLELERLSGEPENWKTLNKRFLVAIRRHFLAWRTRPKARVLGYDS